MSLRLLDKVWDPNTPANADWAFVDADVVLLLDGAAPVAPERVSTAHDDTVWMVRRFTELFPEQRATDAAGGVPALVEGARLALRRGYDELYRGAGSAERDALRVPDHRARRGSSRRPLQHGRPDHAAPRPRRSASSTCPRIAPTPATCC